METHQNNSKSHSKQTKQATKLTVRIIIKNQLDPGSNICSNIQGEEEDNGHRGAEAHKPHDESLTKADEKAHCQHKPVSTGCWSLPY